MADVEYVEALSGEEIIVDLCSLIAEKLRKDCNLRDSDSYGQGYSARVTIHLEAYGMDTAVVEAEVKSGEPKPFPDTQIDTILEVPAEPALDQVRERSDQPVPTLTRDESGQPEVRPRRYIRQDRLVERVAAGGATGEKL
jgi:hypothetical protein